MHYWNGKKPDSAILLNCDHDGCSLGYGQMKEAFIALIKDDFFQPCISEDDFRSSDDGSIIGYNLYVFDIRYQKMFEIAQPIKVEFKCLENVPAGIYGYALVLTNKLVSKNSDGQRHFELI